MEDYFKEDTDEIKELYNEECNRNQSKTGLDFEKTQKTYNGRWTD